MFRTTNENDPDRSRRVGPWAGGVRWTVIATVLLICLGCQSPFGLPLPLFRRAAPAGPLLSQEPLPRLIVVPVENHSPHPEAMPLVRDALQSELQAAGRFEVQMADAFAVEPSGRLYPSEYVEILPALIRERHPDVILLCTVTEYRPYPPMTLGLQIRLINAHDATTVASIDSVWEAPTQVLEGRPMAPPVFSDTSPYAIDSGAIAHSPRVFARAVASEIAANLVGAMPRPVLRAPDTTGATSPEPAGMPGSDLQSPAPMAPPAMERHQHGAVLHRGLQPPSPGPHTRPQHQGTRLPQCRPLQEFHPLLQYDPVWQCNPCPTGSGWSVPPAPGL